MVQKMGGKLIAGQDMQKLTEAQILRQIMDYLELHRIFAYRNNTGAMTGVHKGKRWFVRFGKRGAPDIIAIRGGQCYGIEVKRPGNDQSREQREFQVEFERSGAKYILARAVEDVAEGMR